MLIWNLVFLAIENSVPIAPMIQFEDVSSTSMYVVLSEANLKSSEDVIGYNIWHRKVEERTYYGEAICVLRPERTWGMFWTLNPI